MVGTKWSARRSTAPTLACANGTHRAAGSESIAML
jgi:hypothetical protein